MQTDDSSDIARHLKTVHLALVVACALISTVLFGGSPSTVQIARGQLDTVIAIKENWINWNRRFGYEQLTWLRANAMAPSPLLPSMLYVTTEELIRRNISSQTHEWSISPKYSIYFYMYIRRPPTNIDQEEIIAWVQKTDQGLRVNSRGSTPIRSLQDFRYFWDAADKFYVFLVTEFSQLIYLVLNGEISNSLSWTSTERASQQSALELWRTGLGLKGQEKCDGLVDKLLPQLRPKFDIFFCGKSPIENEQAVLPARVKTLNVPINLRLWLAKEFAFHSVGKRFEETFPELHQLTGPYQELGLDNVKTILEGELRRAGERIQFLGLTFPERLVFTWGIAMILVIHAYLCIQLRELRCRLGPTDDAHNVAWIGLYPGLLARLCSILTAAVLPFGVVLYLALIQQFSFLSIGIAVIDFSVAAMVVVLLCGITKRAAA